MHTNITNLAKYPSANVDPELHIAHTIYHTYHTPTYLPPVSAVWSDPSAVKRLNGQKVSEAGADQGPLLGRRQRRAEARGDGGE
eukprot:6280913-Pyramimonas_sp.AAC.1